MVLANACSSHGRWMDADFSKFLAKGYRLAASEMTQFWPDQARFNFGYILWKILGAKKVDVDLAASRLGLSSAHLRNIFRGEACISQKMLVKKQWRKILSANYRLTWMRHKSAFEKAARKLPEISERKITRCDEPLDKNGFGYALWLLIGGKNADLKEGARCLGVYPSHLSAIIHGQRVVLHKTIKEKGWQKALAERYPYEWKKYGPIFEQRAATLPHYSKKQPRDPDANADFGLVLWLIIGDESRVEEAAELLDMSCHTFRKVIGGKKSVSQAFLRENQWREKLAQKYPDRWPKYAPLFEEYAAQFPAQSINKPLEPKDKYSFGHALWLILGGKEACLTEAAERLKIHPTTLGEIIHSRQTISLEAISEKKWRKTLSEDYRDAWAKHRQIFEQRARRQRGMYKGTSGPKGRLLPKSQAEQDPLSALTPH